MYSKICLSRISKPNSCKNGQDLLQVVSSEQPNKPTMGEKDATSAFQSVNGGGRGSPSDRPHGSTVSETFMKQLHALKQLDKHSKNIKENAAPRRQAVRTELRVPVRSPTLKCVQTQFREVSFINKVMSCFLVQSCCFLFSPP